MINIIGVFMANELFDQLVWSGIRKALDTRKAELECREWRVRQRIPVLGWIIKKKVPVKVNGLQSHTEKTVVKLSRSFVETKTFEDVVSCIVRNKLKMPKPSSKPQQSRWAEVNIVS